MTDTRMNPMNLAMDPEESSKANTSGMLRLVAAEAPDPQPNPAFAQMNATCAPCGPVCRAAQRRRQVVRLDGFYPGCPCRYRRVLVPVQTCEAVLPA